MELRPHLIRRQVDPISRPSNNWVTLCCVTATPFGTPVVPEV